MEKIKKVAIIHDWLTVFGGSEQVVLSLLEIYPEADLYTSIYDEKKLGDRFSKYSVKTTWLQHIPGSKRFYQLLLPLMPRSFESLNLTQYDLVISSSHACAKGVITPLETLHLSYIHTPMRYAWEYYHFYYEKSSWWVKIWMWGLMPRLRVWDQLSSLRADAVAANSFYVSKQIQKYYHRFSTVIYPPVSTTQWKLSNEVREEYYVAWSRMVAYKRLDLAIEACGELKRNLIVIGDGPLEKKLKKYSFPGIRFTGRLSQKEIQKILSRAKGFIFPGKEDFGIIPVEVQATGTPVIAYQAGGALETIIEGETGLFFATQTVDSLCIAIQQFEKMKWDSKKISHHAKKFSQEEFKGNIMRWIQKESEKIIDSGRI